MTPSDYAAWVQAIGSVAGIAVAIWVPFRVHQSEQRATQRAKNAYSNVLRDAFSNLREHLAYLDEVDPEPDWTEQQPHQVAEQLSLALEKMEDLSVVLSEIQDLKRLDNFNAILAILEFRRSHEEAGPALKNESRWLTGRGHSPNVVNNALATLKYHAEELLERTDKVLAALETDESA